MSLSILVGVLADTRENNPEIFDEYEKQFELINTVLSENKLSQYVESVDALPWSDPLGFGGFPYSWIHYLRRYYAHRLAAPDIIPAPMPARQRVTDDPVLRRMSSRKSHLIYHSDCEGFYLPVDFPDVIEDERVPGLMLGSTQRLLAELRTLAEPLGFAGISKSIPNEQIEHVLKEQEQETPYFIERSTWLTLFTAANYSLDSSAAILFA